MKKKLLSILAGITLGVANLTAQTATLSIVTQPCNYDGQVSITTSGLPLPITYKYYLRFTSTSISSVPTAIHPNVNSTTDTYGGIPSIIIPQSGILVIAVSGSDSAMAVAYFTPPFTYSVSLSPAVCPALGSITVSNITGGSSPYAYHFTNNLTGQSYATNPASVPAGGYTLSVTDASGCQVACTYSNAPGSTIGGAGVQNISPVTVTVSGTSANCANGTATALASGGTLPYTYLWNNGATTQTITGLSSGLYSCTVRDAQGCYETSNYFVPQSVNISVYPSVTNANCAQANGSILSFVVGGTAPYTYLWDNGATTQNISGLTGNAYYNVRVTDASNCTGTANVYITSATPITTSYSVTPSACTLTTGGATVNPVGGTAPYTTHWYTYPSATTGNSISNKPSGNYSFIITDAVGCSRTGTAFIPPATTLSGYIQNSAIVCPLTTGNLVATVSGGNSPFTYTWSNGSSAAGIINVPAGTYDCIIKDAAGCTITKYGSINEVSPVNVSFASTPASCIYAADGSILANATGGTAPYTYTWSNGQTSATATGLVSGNYYVSVTDANGCYNLNNNIMASVGYNSANTSCYCTITGTVYADANNNCVRDAGENGINNIQIHCSGFGYTYTDVNGVYSFMVPSGTYTVSETVQTNYFLASCQSNNVVLSVSASAGCILPVNFANMVLPVHDLRITTLNVTPAIPGNPYQQRVVVYNEGTVPETTIKLGYTHDGQLSYSNSTPWTLTQQNSTIYPNWYSVTSGFPTIIAGGYSSANVNYVVPTNIPVNTILNFEDTVATALPLATSWLNDHSPWNNVDSHQAVIVSSFDPNFKEVSPRGAGIQGYITVNDSILTYVVHFQNEGTYFAQNIVVVDSLSSHLNISSLRPGYSDRSYVTTVDENGVIRFKFDNINLPWKSAYGDVMSSGMFTYTVKLKSNLPMGTKIKNTAAIYFDYNAPVITNTTLNTIVEPGFLSVKEQTMITSDHVLLYPNPTNNGFSMVISSVEKTESELIISDISGRILSQKPVSLQAGENTLHESTDDLQSGIYFVQLKNKDILITKKVVVTK